MARCQLYHPDPAQPEQEEIEEDGRGAAPMPLLSWRASPGPLLSARGLGNGRTTQDRERADGFGDCWGSELGPQTQAVLCILYGTN